MIPNGGGISANTTNRNEMNLQQFIPANWTVPSSKRIHPNRPMHTDNTSGDHLRPESSLCDEATQQTIQNAFNLPIQYPFVKSFLFQDDDVGDVCAISSGIQKASAATLQITQTNPKDATTPDNASLHPNAIETYALIPVFSKDHITLGVQVSQIVAPHAAMNIEPNFVFCGRFAFDTQDTSLLIVACFPVDGIVYVTHLSHHIVEGKRRMLFALNATKLKLDKQLTPTVLFNYVKYYDVHQEDKEVCMKCGQPASSLCECSFDTRQPAHPLDYSTFAPNMVLLSGRFTGTRRRWKRGRNGRAVTCNWNDSSCNIEAHVDHDAVMELCRLNRANLAKRSGHRRDAMSQDDIEPNLSSSYTRGDMAMFANQTPESLFTSGLTASGSMADAASGSFEIGTFKNFFGLPPLHDSIDVQFPDVCNEMQPGGPAGQQLTPVLYTIADSFVLQGRTEDAARPEKMDASTSLRKIRNREAAARSNQKRKENLEILVRDLEAARARMKELAEKEEQLRRENLLLKEKLGYH